MIIDMHANITPPDAELFAQLRARGLPADPADCLVGPTLRRMDANGVDLSVVWQIGRSSEECRRNNEFVAAERDRHPDRFIPFATVYPHDVDAAIAEVDRAVDELGMAGVKMHPVLMQITLDDPRFIAVLRHVGERDLPFVTHVSPTLSRDLPVPVPPDAEDDASAYQRPAWSDPARLRALAAGHDSPRFQAAHMGAATLPWMRGANISLQTTGASYEVLAWAVATLGYQRIVFGSDFPFFLVEDEIAKVRRLPLPEREREAIFSANAIERVLRIRPLPGQRQATA